MEQLYLVELKKTGRNWIEKFRKSYCYEYFPANSSSGKVLFLKLWGKMLLANQIARSFIVLYVNKESRIKLIFCM